MLIFNKCLVKKKAMNQSHMLHNRRDKTLYHALLFKVKMINQAIYLEVIACVKKMTGEMSRLNIMRIIA